MISSIGNMRYLSCLSKHKIIDISIENLRNGGVGRVANNKRIVHMYTELRDALEIPRIQDNCRVPHNRWVIPTSINNIGEINPWVNIKRMVTASLNDVSIRMRTGTGAIWKIELYAINFLKSDWEQQSIPLMTYEHINNGMNGFKILISLNLWIRISPTPPNLRRIPAKIMDPKVGASTWATGNQKWMPSMGSLTPKVPKDRNKNEIFPIFICDILITTVSNVPYTW